MASALARGHQHAGIMDFLRNPMCGDRSLETLQTVSFLYNV